MRRCTLAYLILALVSCQATTDPTATNSPGSNSTSCKPKPPSKPGITKILFVGNSLTYQNDLPSLVAAIGVSKGNAIENEMLASPNYALEDHWKEGCLQRMISSGYYDFVVVQQGPSSQSDGAKSLLEYGALIQELCKKSDTRLAFFMVWPARFNYHMFGGVIANYTAAAESTGAILCSVGTSWKEHIDDTGDWSYYGPDQFHPSAGGSEVAAQIIYSTLFP